MSKKKTKQKLQTEWNLKLLYRSLTDPHLKKDAEKIKRTYGAFAKKYKNKTAYLRSDTALLKVLQEYEKLLDTGNHRCVYYLHYRTALDSSDTKAQALLNKLSQELTVYTNKVLFFELRLAQVSSAQKKAFLNSKKLSTYRYFLENLFRLAQYNLSEPEEKIMSLMSLPSYDMWVDGVEKLLGKQMVTHGGKRLSISEAVERVADMPLRERRSLWRKSIQIIQDNVSDFAEAEINAVITNKKIRDELRGFQEPYTASILGNENTEKEVLSLAQLVTEHFKIAHRFYRLKRRLLKVDYLTYPEIYRGTPIGKINKTFSYKDSYELLREEFYKFGNVYGEILDTFVKNGHIDVYPKKGKRGGAFCSGSNKNPTFVLLNHVNTLRSVTTFAHEMGHAVHFELLRKQPIFYRGTSTSTAETASTFFENLVFERLFQELSPKEQILALHDKIGDAIATVFRQIAGFNFEIELHETIRDKGYIPKEEIVNIKNKHMRSYLGNAVKVEDLDGYFFVKWSHIRMFFYVYTYCYGYLVSQALYSTYQQQPMFEKQIRSFLCAGSSKSPKDIFKDIGVDTTKPIFFREGLKNIERDIARLEKMVKN